MKRFKELREELLNEGGGDMMPADEMTISELKIACFAANNILERLEGGAMIQRWQISAIVKAKEELASVYTSISADEMDMDDMDAYDDMEDEEEPMYVGFEYPSMYGEEVELDEAVDKDHPIVKEYHALKKNDIKTLRNMIAGQRRISDVSEFRSKDHAVSAILRDKYGHKKVDKAFGFNEEVELDEVSDKKLDAYRQKAFADQPSGDDGSDKYRKRKFGRDLAFDKQTGRAKVLATKEEVELDEISYRDSGAQNMMRADREAARAVAKMRAQAAKRAEKEAAKKKPVKEETDYEVDVEGLPKMYVKANSPAEVKTNLRKVVKNPEMIRGVERVAKMALQKMFRDKAAGKDTEE